MSLAQYAQRMFGGNLVSVYDYLDLRGSVIGSGGQCALWHDVGGGSNQLAYCSLGTASQKVVGSAKVVTGSNIFNLDILISTYTQAKTLIDKHSGNNGFQIALTADGHLNFLVGNGSSTTTVPSNTALGLTPLTRHTLTINWADGVGATFSIDGVAMGAQVAAAVTMTDSGGTLTVDNTSLLVAIFRFQVGTVYDLYPQRDATVLGTSWVSGGASAETYTLTSSGDLGCKVCGLHDLHNLTTAHQPVLQTTGGFLTNGSNQYLGTPVFSLAQPWFSYDILALPSYTVNSRIFDGLSNATGQLYENPLSPYLALYAGSGSPNYVGGMVVGINITEFRRGSRH